MCSLDTNVWLPCDNFRRSDFTCNNKRKDSWNGFAPEASVGNCVWNIRYYYSGGVQIAGDFYRIAEATATW